MPRTDKPQPPTSSGRCAPEYPISADLRRRSMAASRISSVHSSSWICCRYLSSTGRTSRSRKLTNDERISSSSGGTRKSIEASSRRAPEWYRDGGRSSPPPRSSVPGRQDATIEPVCPLGACSKQTKLKVPAVGTVNVKDRAASGTEPGGAFGGSHPVLKNAVAFSVRGDFPVALVATELSGSWGSVVLPAKEAVWGSVELLTKTTLSPFFMFTGTGENARTAVCCVDVPISTVHVLEPSGLVFGFGTDERSVCFAARPSSS